MHESEAFPRGGLVRGAARFVVGVAEKQRTASCFTSGVERGMKIFARTPSSFAASATPCAWFPAEAATMPRERSSGESSAMRL